jgi:p-hydroxybenzoate 3-monooxygenase
VIRERTQVAVIGAGPAGLLLGQLLHRQGIEAVILESRSRAYVEARIRAGVLEQGTVEVLREAGVGERMDREGLPHGGIYINYGATRHHIPMTELTGGRGVMIYGQTEVVKDLIAARLSAQAPLHFDCADVTVDGLRADEAVVGYTHDGEAHELRCDLVAGCDGFHGVCRTAMPDDLLDTWGRE